MRYVGEEQRLGPVQCRQFVYPLSLSFIRSCRSEPRCQLQSKTKTRSVLSSFAKAFPNSHVEERLVVVVERSPDVETDDHDGCRNTIVRVVGNGNDHCSVWQFVPDFNVVSLYQL